MAARLPQHPCGWTPWAGSRQGVVYRTTGHSEGGLHARTERCAGRGLSSDRRDLAHREGLPVTAFAECREVPGGATGSSLGGLAVSNGMETEAGYRSRRQQDLEETWFRVSATACHLAKHRVQGRRLPDCGMGAATQLAEQGPPQVGQSGPVVAAAGACPDTDRDQAEPYPVIRNGWRCHKALSARHW